MSRGPENNFISSVHKHLPMKLYRMKNNNPYNGGIADVWYSGSKADLWIEYKFVKLPARDTTPSPPGFLSFSSFGCASDTPRGAMLVWWSAPKKAASGYPALAGAQPSPPKSFESFFALEHK